MGMGRKVDVLTIKVLHEKIKPSRANIVNLIFLGLSFFKATVESFLEDWRSLTDDIFVDQELL